jgi:hypothetical protein
MKNPLKFSCEQLLNLFMNKINRRRISKKLNNEIGFFCFASLENLFAVFCSNFSTQAFFRFEKVSIEFAFKTKDARNTKSFENFFLICDEKEEIKKDLISMEMQLRKIFSFSKEINFLCISMHSNSFHSHFQLKFFLHS